MTLKSFLLILQRQFTQKWGRFLLASGGIMIGIWAITLTSSLSLGLSDTIIKAINSQPSAKEFNIFKSSSGQTNFFDITEAPKFLPVGLKDVEKIKQNHPEVNDVLPVVNLDTFIINSKELNFSCVELEKQNLELLKKFQAGNPNNTNLEDIQDGSANKIPKEYQNKCPILNFESIVFQNFYESNRTKWLGKSEKLGRGEVAVCFKCGILELSKSLGANEPKDLLDKEITLELLQAPASYELGNVVDTERSERGGKPMTKSVKVPLKIVSVIDDRENSDGLFGGRSPLYLDFSYYLDAIKSDKPEVDLDKIGFLTHSVVLNSFEDLDKSIKQFEDEKYLPISITQQVIAGVKSGFAVLTAVLSAFGLIALVASIFGIVNVMTISVLERQKEIGVLKSLGARDRDIFNIFLIESAFLGLIGWTLGILLSLGSGALITAIFKFAISENPEWSKNLESLNIKDFSPTFPWWLLLGSLGIAVIFTVLSGVFPAIKAAKQNPVEVLRSE